MISDVLTCSGVLLINALVVVWLVMGGQNQDVMMMTNGTQESVSNASEMVNYANCLKHYCMMMCRTVIQKKTCVSSKLKGKYHTRMERHSSSINIVKVNNFLFANLLFILFSNR